VPGIAGVRNITADWKSGAAANAAKLNLSKSEVENMFTLSGLTTSIRIGSVTNGFSVSCKWHAPDGKYVGEADRAFYSIVRYGVKGESVADNIGLKFSGAFQDRGLAKSLYDRQIGQLRKAGFDSIRLEADTTIGRYAWAKKGFDYREKHKTALAGTGRKFVRWAAARNVKLPEGTQPNFKSAHDVATYKIPGISVFGSQIDNHDVPKTMEMSVGKAFMLDKHPQGHGSWAAVMYLQK